MDFIWIAAAVLAFLIFYLVVGVWIFAALLLIAVTTFAALLGFPIERIGAIAKGIVWRSSTTWELSAIPMFILMGDILFRTDISERLFRGLTPWVARIPGGLLHTNILGCTLFAAVSGSSTATTATIGKITVSALRERRYDPLLSIGSLAGAGSLGILIPPSLVMIVYGVLAEVSIAKLFAAGVIPGLMIAGFYTLYIIARCLIDRSLTPTTEERYAWTERWKGLVDLLPVVLLMGIVLGGIYSGLATPSEVAALGAVAAFVLALSMKQMSWATFRKSVLGTVKISSMLCLITVSAALLSAAVGYLHLPGELAKTIGAFRLSPYELIFMLCVMYLVLGLFLDGISITVLSLPIALPLITQAGFDPLWFGVFLVIMVEVGLITPPVGLNLFVIQGLTKQPLGRVARGAIPFFILMLLAASVLTAVPQLALWLPAVLFGAGN